MSTAPVSPVEQLETERRQIIDAIAAHQARILLRPGRKVPSNHQAELANLNRKLAAVTMKIRAARVRATASNHA